MAKLRWTLWTHFLLFDIPTAGVYVEINNFWVNHKKHHCTPWFFLGELFVHWKWTQVHRISWAGRGPWGSSSPTPDFTQDSLKINLCIKECCPSAPCTPSGLVPLPWAAFPARSPSQGRTFPWHPAWTSPDAALSHSLEPERRNQHTTLLPSSWRGERIRFIWICSCSETVQICYMEEDVHFPFYILILDFTNFSYSDL